MPVNAPNRPIRKELTKKKKESAAYIWQKEKSWYKYKSRAAHATLILAEKIEVEEVKAGQLVKEAHQGEIKKVAKF